MMLASLWVIEAFARLGSDRVSTGIHDACPPVSPQAESYDVL